MGARVEDMDACKGKGPMLGGSLSARIGSSCNGSERKGQAFSPKRVWRPRSFVCGSFSARQQEETILERRPTPRYIAPVTAAGQGSGVKRTWIDRAQVGRGQDL